MAKNVDIEMAVKVLRKWYEASGNTPFVRKRVSWALYKAWREIDCIEQDVFNEDKKVI